MKNRIYLVIGCLVLAIVCFLGTNFDSRIESVGNKIYQLGLCFNDNQFPCRWTNISELPYGSPTFNYLAPLPYYSGFLAYKVVDSISFGAKVVVVLPVILFFIGIYMVAGSLYKGVSAVLVSFAMSLLLGYLGLLFSLSAGLIWTAALLPVFCWSLWRTRARASILNSLIVAVLMTALLLSSRENLALVFLGLVFLVVLYLKRVASFKMVLLLIFATVLSLGVSSFYLLPMFAEYNLARQVGEQVFSSGVSDSLPKNIGDGRYQLLTGEANVESFNEGSNWFRMVIDVSTHTIVRFSTQYFPLWEIKVNGTLAENHYSNNDLGLMTVLLGPGKYVVEGRLYDTPVRILANYISSLSLAIFLIVLIGELTRARKVVWYYVKSVGK